MKNNRGCSGGVVGVGNIREVRNRSVIGNLYDK